MKTWKGFILALSLILMFFSLKGLHTLLIGGGQFTCVSGIPEAAYWNYKLC